jgi:cytochrome c oxidase cbb3-type subunit 3
MKIFTIRLIPTQSLVTAMIIAAVMGVTGCGTENAPPASQPGTTKAPSAGTAGSASPESKLIAEGEAIFNKMCKSCHGSRGNGWGSRSGPSLQKPELTYGRTPEAITQSIRDGRPRGMPSFNNALSPSQLEAISSYVMSLKQ